MRAAMLMAMARRVASRMLSAKGQGRYKGKVYNILYMGDTKYGPRARLQFLDGSKDFWVDASLVDVVRGTAPRAPVPPRSRAPSAPRRPSPPHVSGERTVERKSKGRDDGYDVGEVIRLPRVSGGGGPDGHWWVVIESRKYQEPDEDEWMVSARVRPATDAEALPHASALDQKKFRDDMLEELDKLVRNMSNLVEDIDKTTPGAKQIVLFRNMAGSDYYIVEDDRVIRITSDYDMGPRYWVSKAPRALEIAKLLAT